VDVAQSTKTVRPTHFWRGFIVCLGLLAIVVGSTAMQMTDEQRAAFWSSLNSNKWKIHRSDVAMALTMNSYSFPGINATQNPVMFYYFIQCPQQPRRQKQAGGRSAQPADPLSLFCGR
jgi:hypothetical protein